MAYLEITVRIDRALDQLVSIGVSPDADDELGKLMNVLSTIKSFILDVDEPLATLPKIGEVSIAQIIDGLYGTEDVLDDLLPTIDRGIKVNKITFPPKLTSLWNSRVGIIRSNLQLTAIFLKLAHGGCQSQVVDRKYCSKRYPIVHESDTVGREEDKEWMVSHLLLGSPNHEVQQIDVIPIIGAGGMGKTTLAQLVFNDKSIVDHFYHRLWVHVSNNFDLEIVIRNIICSAIGNISTKGMYTPSREMCHLNLQELQAKLTYVLRSGCANERALLVLDDVWIEEEDDQWRTLMELLSECSFKGKIIVTTQIEEKVARVMGTTKARRLGALGAHDSWSLFARKVFTEEGEEEAYPELVKLGMHSLVPKCMGDPLALEILAGCLRMERDHQSWKRIAEIELRGMDSGIHPIIEMCFNQLPSNLKACFAFCSLFEKGTRFRRSELIRLWSAEGLLGGGIEDAGHKCFDELISRSFFQIPRLDDKCQSYDGTVECVEMHNLIHDLAVNVARGEEVSIVKSNSRHAPATVRHIAWGREDLTRKGFPAGLKEANGAITFVLMHPMGSLSKSFLEGLLSNFKLLRVLMLSGSIFEELPDLIGDLTHLKLLALDQNTRLKKLPNSICNLMNLEALDTRHCSRLSWSPEGLHELINLRHLGLTSKLGCSLNNALRGWISLERLHMVGCSFSNLLSADFSCLTKLRVLEIAQCSPLVSLPDSMKCLNNIEELKIQGCWCLDLTRWEGLQGMSRLRHLAFVGLWQTREFPDGIDSAASSLQCLEIISCERLVSLPEGLRCCTFLLKLELNDCENLKAIPSGLHSLKNLRQLRIEDCPELRARFEGDDGIEWPFISQIPSVILDFKPQSASMDATHNAGTKNQYTNTDSSLVPTMQSQEIELEGDAKGKGSLIYGETPMDELQHFPSSSSKTENSPKEMDEEAVLAGFPDEIRKICSSILYLFFKDCEFEQETLVQLWMGMGVITNEAAGESCTNYLLEKGWIFLSGTNFVTGVDSYRPDFKRICADLSLQTGDDSRFYLKWEDSNQYPMSNEIQHVSLVCYDDIDVAEVFRTLSNFHELRTLMFLGNYGHKVKEVPNHLFESMKGLRVLDLSRTHVRKLPGSLRCLAHLHYLDLSWTPIDQLPETMCYLDELQTLKLRGCSSLRRLPQQLKMLTSLRHLDIDVLRQLTIMPYGIGALKDLRTLPGFLVDVEDGCKIGELENLNNLTGSFCVAMLENVDSVAEVKKAALWKKDSIRKLELRWTASQLLKMDNKTCDALDYLKPSLSLEELKVLCYGGLTFPNWIADTRFNKFVSLTLFKCEVVSRLPSVEQLPSLRYLKLVKMNGIVEISRQVSCDQAAFPKLEELTIDEMLSLRSWSWMEANEADFECLAELSVNNCPKLQRIDVLPYLSSIKCIEIRECLELESLAKKKLPDGLQDLIDVEASGAGTSSDDGSDGETTKSSCSDENSDESRLSGHDDAPSAETQQGNQVAAEEAHFVTVYSGSKIRKAKSGILKAVLGAMKAKPKPPMPGDASQYSRRPRGQDGEVSHEGSLMEYLRAWPSSETK